MELLDEGVDLGRLCQRLRWYGTRHHVSEGTLKGLEELLQGQTVKLLLNLPVTEWFEDMLVNDAYKPSMHRMYASYFSGVCCEFALHVRRSPVALHTIRLCFPVVWEQLMAKLKLLQESSPYPAHVQQALSIHFPGFTLTKEMLARSEAQGVAAVTWSLDSQQLHSLTEMQLMQRVTEECWSGQVMPWTNLREDDCSCIAAGPIEAVSHTETSVMQLVQEAVIAAQVLNIRQQRADQSKDAVLTLGQQQGSSNLPLWPDRTELLASSLAHLGHVIDQLNTLPEGLHITLFAGRRASDRLFLVLQNLACAQLVKGYTGTSSVYVAAVLGKVWDTMGLTPAERLQQLGPLVGTHAHEMSSIMQQLLSDMDLLAGALQGPVGAASKEVVDAAAPGPVVVSSLLAHLLFIATTGDLEHAVALPDTFSTPAWLLAALSADVPPRFAQHMQHVHNKAIPSNAKVFDLIRVWRIDSGSYEHIAGLVMDAWEQRCATLRAAAVLCAPTAELVERGSLHVAEPAGPAACAALDGGAASPGSQGQCSQPASQQSGGVAERSPLPVPKLMHSNLSSIDDVLQVAALPERIRPTSVAFGSLADGFFPLVPPEQANNSPADAEQAVEQIQMASMVMKAVQARAAKVTVTQASALKAGDVPPDWPTGKPFPKLEVDPRVTPSSCQAIQALAQAMRQPALPNVDNVSMVLAQAWSKVVDEGLLKA